MLSGLVLAWCSLAGENYFRCFRRRRPTISVRALPRPTTASFNPAAGIGAILGGPLAALLFQSAGKWVAVFVPTIAANFLTPFLAIAVLKPMRRRHMLKGS